MHEKFERNDSQRTGAQRENRNIVGKFWEMCSRWLPNEDCGRDSKSKKSLLEERNRLLWWFYQEEEEEDSTLNDNLNNCVSNTLIKS